MELTELTKKDMLEWAKLNYRLHLTRRPERRALLEKQMEEVAIRAYLREKKK